MICVQLATSTNVDVYFYNIPWQPVKVIKQKQQSN